jgi:hypothetical protein
MGPAFYAAFLKPTNLVLSLTGFVVLGGHELG